MSNSDVRATYDRVAATYAARFEDELAGKPRDRELLTAFAAAVGDPVLDFGCGPGQIGAFVRDTGRRVVGADLSGAMAALAGGRLDGAAVADLLATPFRSASIGGVVAFYSLIHLGRPTLSVAFAELHRILRPGGRVLAAMHEGTGDVHVESFLDEPVSVDATFFQLDELTAAASDAGLTVELAERRAPYATEGATVRLYLQAVRTS